MSLTLGTGFDGFKQRTWRRLGQVAATMVSAQNPVATGWLCVLIISIQLVAAGVAAGSLLMLHADGSYFVYAISIGATWDLKWKDTASRAATYVYTVLPTEIISHVLNLSPLQIAAVNGAIFYLVPPIQFAIACAIIWRGKRRLLIFPIAQYAFASSFGFGFPSEILLAPGFLWIACLLVATGKAANLSFIVAWSSLLFSHEMAIPAAIIVGIAAGMTMRVSPVTRERMHWIRVCWTLILIFIFYLAVRRYVGGAGLNWALLYAIDPRRTFASVSLVIMAASVAIGIFVQQRLGREPKSLLLRWSTVVLAALAPLLLFQAFPILNFEQGRYESARSLVSGTMVILSLAFFATLRSVEPQESSELVTARQSVFTPLVVCIALSVSISTSSLFLKEWNLALSGLKAVVSSAPPGATPTFISYAEARQLMSPDQAWANDRISYHWSLIFRSAVVADGATPSKIVLGERGLFFGCDKRPDEALTHRAIPAETAKAIRSFVCSHQVEPPSLERLLSRKFKALFTTWFGASPEPGAHPPIPGASRP